VKTSAYILIGVLAITPAARWVAFACQTVSAGAATDATSGSFQNAGQTVIGRTIGGGVYLHAGIIPCLAAAQCIQVAPDLDHDCDVDDADLELFEACAAGGDLAHDGTAVCTQADFDGDGDVDVVDYGTFQRCRSGPGNQPDPHCND